MNKLDTSHQLTSFNAENNTFKKERVVDNARRVEIEIGDDKEPTRFLPQFKTKHWDNEANLSVRLKDDDYDTGEVKTVANKVEWKKGIKTARLYELETDDEDGGFEFEVEFSEKPDTNVVEYTLQSKEFDFFYQSPLTPEEIEQGAIRAENVEGSYAVYHKTQKNNRVGGKHYRTGKAFHIYRPFAEDATGAKAWCELNIEGDLMTVNVPQKFIDTAQYPVRIDPTFGYTSVGGSTQSAAETSTNSTHAYRFTSPSDIGTVSKLTIHLVTSKLFGSTNAKGVIWLQSSLGIVSNGVSGATAVAFGSAEWYDFTYSTEPSLSASTDYYLGYVAADGANGGARIAYDTGTSNYGVSDQANSYSSPASLSGDGTTNRMFSVYATYTVASDSPPTVTTQPVTDITKTTATGNGNVTDDGGATITERGVCWNTSPTPTTANSKATSAGTTGAFTASITGLTEGTTYYVRAYAINAEGTSYGSEVSFVACDLPTVVTHAVTNIAET